MKIVVIIQARMGSTRLPGKALADICGQTMLARVVNRVRRAKNIHDIVIATTTQTADDAIADFCAAHGWNCARGSENDVLDRYYQAAKAANAAVVVRITSDCPLIDPEVLDRVISEFSENQPHLDYVVNTFPRSTFPRGLDTEVMSFGALERAWQEDQNPAWREHVTPYIYRNPEQFRLGGLTSETDYSAMRWTVDTPEDLQFVRLIYGHFGHDDFSWHDVLELLKSHPEWLGINGDIQQKTF